MRYIILGLSLLSALPQSAKAERSDFLCVVVAFGVMGVIKLADSISKLSQEEKRKNDLLQEKLNKKLALSITPIIDPIAYFETLSQSVQSDVAAQKTLSRLCNNNPLLQQKYTFMQEKSIRLHQEISDYKHWVSQLNNEQRQQFGLLQQYNVSLTQEDIKILIALKQRGYSNIPNNIIDETLRNYIELEKHKQRF